MAPQLNLAANYCLRFLNFDFDAILAQFSGKFRQSRNSKIEDSNWLPNLVEKLYSKFQVVILKNVGREAFIVIAFG